MQKPTLRPLRLVHLKEGQLDKQAQDGQNGEVNTDKHKTTDTIQTIQKELVQVVPNTPLITDVPNEEAEARQLLKRTPSSYLLNQAYGLWVFVSLFLLTAIVTRNVTVEQYGVYGVALAAFNTIAYVVAFGLEDATPTFVPRVFAEHGRASAADLMRKLLLLRLVTLGIGVSLMLFGMPALANLVAIIPLAGMSDVANGMRDPELVGHIAPIAIYVLGNGVSGLLTAVCAALMRMRVVFIVGSATQVAVLVLSYIVLRMGWGIDGVLWMLALTSLLNAAAFMIWLTPFLILRGADYRQPLKPVINLGISAWLTNLVTGALLKQVSIILLGAFAISIIQIGYFNLSFQLAHAASFLLVSGFGGVGIAALSAAFVGNNYDRLARSWQALIKIETLLAAPGLIFCLFNAQTVATALYGASYDPVGPLLAIFLFFNVLVRVLGTTIHQSTMYVIGKAWLVVLAQWLGLASLVVVGIVCIPRWGAAGALVADGVAQLLIGVLLLAFLWRALPRTYPLGFTLRMLLGLTIAALPAIIWHPTNKVLLGVSGVVFLVLCAGLLMVIKPLTAEDMEMIGNLNPRIAPYLRWFARKA